MSQEEFGEKLGVSRDVIGNIEYDRLKKPEQKEPIYKLICEKFSVSEQWLREGTGEMYEAVEDETASYVSELLENESDPVYSLIKSIMKTYASLDQKEKEVLKAFARNLTENIKSGD